MIKLKIRAFIIVLWVMVYLVGVTSTVYASDIPGPKDESQPYIIEETEREELIRFFDELSQVKAEAPFGWTSIFGPDGKILEFMALGSNSYVCRTNEYVARVVLISAIKNLGPGILSYLTFYNLYPQSGSRQDIEELVFNPSGSQLIQDNRGQRLAVREFQNVSPGYRHETGWQAIVKTWDIYYQISSDDVGSLDEIPSEIRDEYLGDEDIFQITNPVVTQARDQALSQETHPLYMAQNIFQWVQDNLTYEAEGGWDDAPTVIQRGSGSCSEYTFVFIALARSAGLPARWVGSTVRRGDSDQEGPLRDDSKHRWVQVYLPRIGWIHCNVQGGVWGHLPNRYLITTFSGGPSEYTGLRYDSYRYWGWADEKGDTESDRYYLWYPNETSTDNAGEPYDFNGDGKPDVLYRHPDSGKVGVWLMDGTTETSWQYIGHHGTAWDVKGAGDLNGDGQNDILYRHSNGKIGVWLMNGTTEVLWRHIGNHSTSWDVKGMGDFNRDGQLDVLYVQPASGKTGAWLMNGTNEISWAYIGNHGTAWEIKGIGDLDGDGNIDVLYRNTNGNIGAWLMDGTTEASWAYIGNHGTVWDVKCVGDFNSDGKVDVLYQNTSGNVGAWLMNGTTEVSWQYVGNHGPWEIR